VKREICINFSMGRMRAFFSESEAYETVIASISIDRSLRLSHCEQMFDYACAKIFNWFTRSWTVYP